MTRLWLALILVLASASAWADPGQADPAIGAAASADKALGQLLAQRTQLAKKYQDEIDAIDRLKKEKASWRRDRELREQLADSNDTATQLGKVSEQIKAAQAKVDRAHAAAVTAIDAELATHDVAPARGDKLHQLRVQLAPPPAPKKLVIPDAEIDPLADPEELEHKAAAVRAAESELSRQVAGLDAQITELDEVAEVRKAHERTNALALRDEDAPHRTQPHTTGGLTDTPNPAPTAGGAGGAGGNGAGQTTAGGADHFGTQTPTTFESEATVVLSDVIDHAAIEGMLRASRSGDPAQRAEAAKRAREAVRQRLDKLAKQRAAIEARAKSLRH